MPVIALVTDLIFATKIGSTARGVGADLAIVRSVEALETKLAGGASLVMIDMNADGVDAAEAIRKVKAQPDAPPVLAYLSHVQTELADAARSAGADAILPRSQFSAELPTILQQHA